MKNGVDGVFTQVADYRQLDDGRLTIVVQALENEYKGLVDSLKMNRPGQESSRVSSSEVGSSSADAGKALPAAKAQEGAALADKVAAMESHAKELIETVVELQQKTAQVPLIWEALSARMGLEEQTRAAEPEPNIDGDGKEKKGGGFFG